MIMLSMGVTAPMEEEDVFVSHVLLGCPDGLHIYEKWDPVGEYAYILREMGRTVFPSGEGIFRIVAMVVVVGDRSEKNWTPRLVTFVTPRQILRMGMAAQVCFRRVGYPRCNAW